MTDEEEAFIAGVEMGIDWNLYIPPSDHARYDYLIWKQRKQNKKEEVEVTRLTYKENSGAWGLRGLTWEEIDTKAYPELYMALCKLKDYEDIGLNPDQVERLDGLYLEKCKEVNVLQEQIREIQERLGVLQKAAVQEKPPEGSRGDLKIFKLNESSYVAHNLMEFLNWYHKFVNEIDSGDSLDSLSSLEIFDPEDGVMWSNCNITPEDIAELEGYEEICKGGVGDLMRRDGEIFKLQTYADVLGDEDTIEPYEIASTYW